MQYQCQIGYKGSKFGKFFTNFTWWLSGSRFRFWLMRAGLTPSLSGLREEVRRLLSFTPTPRVTTVCPPTALLPEQLPGSVILTKTYQIGMFENGRNIFIMPCLKWSGFHRWRSFRNQPWVKQNTVKCACVMRFVFGSSSFQRSPLFQANLRLCRAAFKTCWPFPWSSFCQEMESNSLPLEHGLGLGMNRMRSRCCCVTSFFLFIQGRTAAYGSSQARGPIGVAAAGLHHSHRIWAASATHTTAHSNAGSLTHWARSGTEPASSWTQVRFATAELQRGLRCCMISEVSSWKAVASALSPSLSLCLPVSQDAGHDSLRKPQLT